MMKQAIEMIIEGLDLSLQQAAEVMNCIMDGEATQAQTGGILTALRMKGETVEEITGFAGAMREKSVKIIPKTSMLIDTCGTGGDCTGTFNISTAAAFVVSAAGICVAKHGNRSVSSKSGSADVLEALDVNIDIPRNTVEKCIEDIGIGFMFAPHFHKAMKHVAAPRRELGIRTVFNILGPLTNPAGARYQLLGVYDEKLTEPLACVLQNLGTSRAMVVHGMDGMDEITITDKTRVAELKDGKVKSYTISPEDFGMQRADMASIKGGDSETNAGIIRAVFSGQRGAKSDIVALNAGAAIYICGRADSLAKGVQRAQQILENGSAAIKLDEMIKYTNAILSRGKS